MLAIWSLALRVNGFQNYCTYKLKNTDFWDTHPQRFGLSGCGGAQASVAPLGDVKKGAREAHSETRTAMVFACFPDSHAQAVLTGGTCSPSTC